MSEIDTLQDRFKHIRIVMIGTTHPGNIGAAARAMFTMGLQRLVLVQPEAKFPSGVATARASGANKVLDDTQVFDNLSDAIADCSLVMGASARARRIAWPEVQPDECAQKALESKGEVALLLGREHSGLNNEELEACQYLVRIPTNPKFSSLNVASALQVLSYEVRRQALMQAPPEVEEEPHIPVDSAEMERFYAHLEQTLVDIDFLDPDNPRLLMRKLRRLFHRAEPNISEANILRGILKAAQKSSSTP